MSASPAASLFWSLLVVMVAAAAAVEASGPHVTASRGPHHPRGQASTHSHYRPHRPPSAAGEQDPAPKLTGDQRLLHDAEHIREDLGDWVTKEDTSRMTTEELEFHYFQIHDVDNNTKLDGLEMLQAILHTGPHDHDEGTLSEGGGDGEGTDGTAARTAEDGLDGVRAGGALRQEEAGGGLALQDDFNYFVELIDRVLLEDDLDRDGYLSYVEYVMGRQRDDQQRRHATMHEAASRPA